MRVDINWKQTENFKEIDLIWVKILRKKRLGGVLFWLALYINCSAKFCIQCCHSVVWNSLLSALSDSILSLNTLRGGMKVCLLGQRRAPTDAVALFLRFSDTVYKYSDWWHSSVIIVIFICSYKNGFIKKRQPTTGELDRQGWLSTYSGPCEKEKKRNKTTVANLLCARVVIYFNLFINQTRIRT